MCGVFGITGPGITQLDLKIFKELGTISQLRGREGAGVWQTKTGASKQYLKGLELWDKSMSCWDEFMDEVEDEKSLKSLMNSTMIDVLMGHVRHPTKGKRDVNNSHPFVFKAIVGMHNGTLKDKKYQDPDRTDSELLFVDIINDGLLPTLRSLDKDSAYALTIYDRESQVLRFTRNNKRPLSFAMLEERGVLYWASESEMLKLALNRRGIKHTIIGTRENRVYKVIPRLLSAGSIEKALSYQLIFPEQEVKKEEPKVEAKKEDKETKNLQVGKTEGNVTHVHPRMSSSTALVVQNPPPGVHASSFAKPKEDKTVKNKRLPMRSFHSSCHCGAKTMNLMDTFRSKRGEKGFPKFDHNTSDKFWCDDCLKNTNEVGNA